MQQMNNITIKQMRYFEAVASNGHFGRAADACSISQPAISLQIKELEQTIGNVLFERHARHIRLTAFGEEFSRHVRSILRSIDDLGDLARAARSGLSGKLRMGVIPTIAPYLLPGIIGDLSQSFPELDLHIRETQTDNLILGLVDGRLDVALVALPISEASLMEFPLFEESFVLVRNLEEADQPVPNIASLKKMRLLLLEEGHCFRDQALAFCGLRPNMPRESMDGSSLSTLVQMVGAGIGVTLIPEMAVDIETKSASVSISRFEKPVPSRTVGMVWRKTTPLAKQLSAISLVIKQSASNRCKATNKLSCGFSG